jgi:serine/threonine-protein kinase
MISALRLCPRCGEEIPADAPEGGCPGCLLESGLNLLADEAAAGFDSSAVASVKADGPGHVDTSTRTATKSERVAQLEGEFGDYELLEEIGRGGQGVVFRARQKSLNRTVALKVISLGQWASKAHLKRFRREAAAAASLDHPCIVPIYEVGEREGACYFSMKFVEGGQLDEVVAREPMSIRNAVELVAKLARTVHYAHEHGVLHRDIKPGNILLDANSYPHLTDFGLARLVEAESTVTRTREVLGTPSYMAPEQAIGNNAQLTNATDVYGLGAVLYQLLTGHPPFAGDTTYETIKLVLDTEPRPPRLINPKVDRELSTISLKCLEKDPKRRYFSALALAEDLEHWLKHEPIRAKRSGVFTRAAKWVRKKPAIAALIASLVVLAAVMGWNIWESELFRPQPEKTIAVLPFSHLSREPENAFIADGVQDTILTDLSRIADLKVVGRTSVMHYKTEGARDLRKIGQELSVAHVVEGTVQRAGNRLRINAQLVDTDTGTVVWAEQYDRDLNDLFAVQSDIAQKIAKQLQTEISIAERLAIERPPTTDLAAFDLYVRGKALIDAINFNERAKENLLQAVRLLGEAVARDPKFLRAYQQLGRAHDLLYFLGMDHTPKRLALAEAAVQNAVGLAPDSGEAHLALAQHRYWAYRDYDGARKELELAGRALPNEPLVLILAGLIDRRRGEWERSTQQLERALQVDPGNIYILQQLSFSYAYTRRFVEMAAVLDRVLGIAPKEANTRVQRAEVELQSRADLRPLRSTIEAVIGEDPDRWVNLALCERDKAALHRALSSLPPEGFQNASVAFPRTWCEGVIARATGDDAGARAAFTQARSELEKIVRDQPDYAEELSVLGMTDAALGWKEEAIREGRRAVELLPVSKDAITGAHLLEHLAVIYAWTGEKDLALDELESTAGIPGELNYGSLRLHPFWDPLRGDARFEKIVTSLAPNSKQAANGHE